MALTVLFVLLALFLILGVPVAVSLGMASLAYIAIKGLPDVLLIHRMIGGIDSFPLLAIPFFILAGHLMNTGGITTKIFSFARSLVGWLPGGLGHVNVGASVIFAGMSGAAVADAGGLGNVEIKAMREAGYDTDFSVGVTAASSTIGPIIPPSLPLVIYGVMASVSIGELFAAGLIPGLLMALSLMIMVAWYSWRRNYPRDSRIDPCRIWATFKEAFLPLLTPIIIVGGIATGIFTPTEAAVAAVCYALFLGLQPLDHLQQMRQGSREAVNPHDHQRVALGYAFQHPRQHRPRTIAARGLFFMDLGAARGFQGLRLGQGGLILGRDPSVTYQGHQNSLFAVSYIVIKRPFVNECKWAFSRRAGAQSLGFLALSAI